MRVALKLVGALAGNLMPGVRIKDNGPKAGLNGVDNGEQLPAKSCGQTVCCIFT